ncbi:D-ribose pyranase [Spiroplasma helicoides]|uniref:D-ribose pyranase n=2 Tax=Spiroplasma helicoides TaxID=216938 RepID=A0A1B3SLU7_9MOLU|nr:D-ribose pyranase [Spiroplasma helicoides]
MLKSNFINSNILEVVSKMGHFDTICICDAGLPIPKEVVRIDLSYVKGKPPFLDLVNSFAEIFSFQKVILASEIKTENSENLNALKKIIDPNKMEFLPHEDFKKLTKNCVAIIRTGECTKFSNIILESGVNF